MTKEKILLFCGTAESKEIATTLLKKGFALTLSTVSGDNLGIPTSDNLSHKTGEMNAEEISSYLISNNFYAVICAVHPYAQQARENIVAACKQTNTRLLLYLREDTERDSISTPIEIYYASNHSEAADIANDFSGNILLTTGSRNLEPYVSRIIDSSERIYARVLDCEKSKTALIEAGIPLSHSHLARGPFSKEQNIEIIQRFNISTLITKDGGAQGGTLEKLLAAYETSTKVVFITRPPVTTPHYSNLESLFTEL